MVNGIGRGHVDSRMVERVYGRLPTDQLAARLSQELGENSLPNVCLRLPDSLDSVDSSDDNAIALSEKTPQKRGFFVPRDGIEPPTRGFSILCSTN